MATVKKILFLLGLITCSFYGFSQTFVERAGPANTVIDYRAGQKLNEYLPHTHGLTLNGGLDTLGAEIYCDSFPANGIWYRDTVLTGGHKWTQIATGSVPSLLSFQNQGSTIGQISTLNIGANLLATIVGGTGTITAIQDTLYLISPLYNPHGSRDTIAVYYVDTVGTDGVLSSANYRMLYYKQNAIQWQQNSVNLGNRGQVTTVNIGLNMVGVLNDSVLTISANPQNVFQNALAWYQGSALLAASGVVDTLILDTGLIGSVTGHRLDIKVQKDTIFPRNLLSAASTDTIDNGGNAFFNTHFNMRGLYTFNFDSLQAGLFLNGLGNKSTLLTTDSVLINDVSGQVWKVPSSAIGGIVGADNGLSIAASDTVQMGGKFTKTTTITGGNIFGLSIDSLSFGQFQAKFSTDTSRYNLALSSTAAALNAVTQNDGTGRIQLVHTGHNILGTFQVAKIGSTIYGAPSFYVNSTDSSVTLQGSKVFIENDTTISSTNAGLYINELPYNSSSTNMTGIGWNTSTGKVYSIPLSSGGGGSSFTRQVFSTGGATVTVTSGNSVLSIDPATTTASVTATMPASPTDLQEVEIHFGGTITTGIVVTSFTVLANSGQTFKDAAVPIGINALATDYYKWRWYNSKSEWERVSN